MATKAIVGEKVGMTQVWTEDGRVVPVTVVRVQPARVVQVKTPETDGYSAVQVTYGSRDARKLTKPKAGQFAKADVEPGVRLVELRLDDVSAYPVGTSIGVSDAMPAATRSWVIAKYDNGNTTPRLVARRSAGNTVGRVIVSGCG